MSPVNYFRDMWHAATQRGPVQHEGRRWTPLLLGAGYTEADAIARAEKLGLVVTAGRSAARKVAFEDQGPEALRELDKASKAFAGLVPWEGEPAPAAFGKEKE